MTGGAELALFPKATEEDQRSAGETFAVFYCERW
jgi:hypothetical protein